MFLTYKRINGVEYGYVVRTSRNEKEISQEIVYYLGRVIDKEKLIFKNRKYGIFHYDDKHEKFLEVPPDFDEPIQKRKNAKQKTEATIIDFGEAYFVNKFAKATGFYSLIHSIDYQNIDTIHALFTYYVVSDHANCYANEWWESSYAKILFPKAKLSSQRLSETLNAIGNPDIFQNFLVRYYQFVRGVYKNRIGILDSANEKKLESVIIDSTGIPNSSKMPITAVNNHNGVVNNEIRLIYAIHMETGMPLFFRYIAGNIIDASTISKTKDELKEQGIDIRFALFDAGYFNHKNSDILYNEGISFLTRAHLNLTICKDAIKKYSKTLCVQKNLHKYNNRFIYIKCCNCNIGQKKDHKAYLYLCKDMRAECLEKEKLMNHISYFDIEDPDDFELIKNSGLFVLISSKKLENDELLSLYYTREYVEDIFKISKNHGKLLPLCIESEGVLRGHLFMTFLATVFHKLISDEIKGSSFSTPSLLIALNTHHAEICKNKILVDEPRKNANDAYKKFNIDVPSSIPFKSISNLCG